MATPSEPAPIERATPAPPPSAAQPPATPPVSAMVGEIEQCLQELVSGLAIDLADPPRVGAGRPRILPSLCLWAGLVVCVLRGFHSQLALWRLLQAGGLWQYPRCPISDQAVYRRLATGGTAPLERLFAQLSAVLADRLAPYTSHAAAQLAPFARTVVALDATTLDKVARLLPSLRPLPGDDPGLLPGKLSGLFDLRLQQWRALRWTVHPHENDKVAAWDLLADLPPGSLVLADLEYFGFAWFDELTNRGHWWVSRLRAKTSLEVIHTYYDRDGVFDGLVWLGVHRADRAQHAVRLVRFPRDGRTSQYLTNVRDPQRLPLAMIAQLYARRWDIELAFKLLKRELGLHLLWAAKPEVVAQQVWAALIIAQVLQALRLEIAGRAGVDPYEVSLPLLVQYLPQYAALGWDPVATFLELGRALRFIRPSSRTVITAPVIPPEAMCPIPPDLDLTRSPRYPARKGTRHDLTPTPLPAAQAPQDAK